MKYWEKKPPFVNVMLRQFRRPSQQLELFFNVFVVTNHIRDEKFRWSPGQSTKQQSQLAVPIPQCNTWWRSCWRLKVVFLCQSLYKNSFKAIALTNSQWFLIGLVTLILDLHLHNLLNQIGLNNRNKKQTCLIFNNSEFRYIKILTWLWALGE